MKTPARLVVLVLLLLVFSINAQSQDLFKQWDEYMAAQHEVNNFIGSVLVAQNGKPLFRKSYGLANAEHGVPNTPQTRFRIGSLTKQFTATAVLLLQEKGSLNVQDRISKYVADSPEAWADITIHHLLKHTSGIPSFTDFPDYLETSMIPSRPEKTLLRFRDKPLNFAPGRDFSYSNSGYILLAHIIEKASGMRYEDFLRENVFAPLGMNGSGHDTFAAIIKHRASGYVLGETGLEHALYHDMGLPMGGGDLYTTVDDMLIWDQALNTNRLLSDESREAMFTPNSSGYGYGWGVGHLFGHKLFSHAGGINGFASQIIRFPRQNAFVIVLCNLETAPVVEVGRGLAAILFAANYSIPERKADEGQ